MSRFYPFYPYLFIFLCHFPLYYLHIINPNRISVIIWLHLIFLSFYATHGKYRCRLSGWPAEPALLVDWVYTDRTPFQRYSGVDHLDEMILTFNKSIILLSTKLSPWQIGSTVCLLALLFQIDLSLYCRKQSLYSAPKTIYIFIFSLLYSFDLAIGYASWHLLFCRQPLLSRFFSWLVT